MSKRWTACACIAAALAALPGCRREERVVRYKPFFAGLEGVQTGQPAVAQRPPAGSPGEAGEIELGEQSLVVENEDGTTTLIARNGMQLMAHIRRLLAEGDADLLASQVLSELTLEEYRQRNLDPREAFAVLKAHEKDILLLFARMPMGEHSPTVIVDQLGRNFFRVRVTGDARKGLGRYSGMDMRMEGGNWKLRWFL